MALESIPTKTDLENLIGIDATRLWFELCERIDAQYDMDRLWNSAVKNWIHEYKYRRGGKTLCGLYTKTGEAGFMVILGAKEREKFDAVRDTFCPRVLKLYDEATTYHDGKWIMFPIDDNALFDDYMRILAIKRRPNKKYS